VHGLQERPNFAAATGLSATKPPPKQPLCNAQVTEKIVTQGGLLRCSAMSLREIIESRKTALTVAEVAALLKVSGRLIYHLVSIGEIPHFKIGSAVRFDPKTLGAWLEEKMTACPDKNAVSRIDYRRKVNRLGTKSTDYSAEWCAVLLGTPWSELEVKLMLKEIEG